MSLVFLIPIIWTAVVALAMALARAAAVGDRHLDGHARRRHSAPARRSHSAHAVRWGVPSHR